MKIVALTGGVGGAKLTLGLSHVLGADELGVLVNTGDDFTHLGFHISPDLDTLMYTLGGVSNAETGWGREGETWEFINTLRGLGGEGWFSLGDRDLAVHVLRRELLEAGMPLAEATRRLYAAHGIATTAWPMSDDRVATQVDTDAGTLAFQHYFVRERCEPRVRAIHFEGADVAVANADALAWLTAPDLDGVIICPSNPFLSVDPILALPAIRAALDATNAPVIAVSPVIGGEAVKGPTTKIMAELELESDAVTVAAHYGALLDGFVLDQRDGERAADVRALGIEVRIAQTLMRSLDDRIELAHTALDFIRTLN